MPRIAKTYPTPGLCQDLCDRFTRRASPGLDTDLSKLGLHSANRERQISCNPESSMSTRGVLICSFESILTASSRSHRKEGASISRPDCEACPEEAR